MNKLYNMALHTLALTPTELRQFLLHPIIVLCVQYICHCHKPISSRESLKFHLGARFLGRWGGKDLHGVLIRVSQVASSRQKHAEGERERAREQGNGASDAALRSGYRPMLSLTGSEGNIPPSHQFILLTLQGGKFVNACLDVYVLHGQRKVLSLCQSLGWTVLPVALSQPSGHTQN